MNKELRKAALEIQQDELTESYIYAALAKRSTQPNRKLLEKIAQDERNHYAFWQKQTGQSCRKKTLEIWWYVLLAQVLGVVFSLRLREQSERHAQQKYAKFKHLKGIGPLIKDEEEHEHALIAMLQDERLEYAGSIVLGLNDALVELTGALAGLTLAIGDPIIVAIAGLVTGIAASMSMGASNYLASREEGMKHPLKSAIYTGVTYIVVVGILILPYFIFSNIFVSLAVTLTLAVLVIAGYTFYITTAKEEKFAGRFLTMAAISLTVAAISFLFGLGLKHFLGI
jgi:VIT1/CCC1 family predicted Fe2+/Mn2+ transporter